jgi:tetratricopeptide (TPR) repeat protein
MRYSWRELEDHPMIKLCAAIALSFSLAIPVAFAAGEFTEPTTTPPLVCKTGEVIKKIKKDGKWVKACVKIESGVLPDEDLYQQGKALAKAGHYDWALKVLSVINNQNDPRVLNYTGYSHRKAGRLEIGITYYTKALAIDPNFNLAREYLGEGYVAAGRLDLARVQLAEIATRCGVTCEEYKDLSAAITLATN